MSAVKMKIPTRTLSTSHAETKRMVWYAYCLVKEDVPIEDDEVNWSYVK